MNDLLRASDVIHAINRVTRKIFSDKHIGESIVGQLPHFSTKEIKYYDEDDSVWKIGRVIVDE